MLTLQYVKAVVNGVTLYQSKSTLSCGWRAFLRNVDDQVIDYFLLIGIVVLRAAETRSRRHSVIFNEGLHLISDER